MGRLALGCRRSPRVLYRADSGRSMRDTLPGRVGFGSYPTVAVARVQTRPCKPCDPNVRGSFGFGRTARLPRKESWRQSLHLSASCWNRSPLILTTSSTSATRANLPASARPSLRAAALFNSMLRRLHTRAGCAPRLRRKVGAISRRRHCCRKRPCCIGKSHST